MANIHLYYNQDYHYASVLDNMLDSQGMIIYPMVFSHGFVLILYFLHRFVERFFETDRPFLIFVKWATLIDFSATVNEQ